MASVQSSLEAYYEAASLLDSDYKSRPAAIGPIAANQQYASFFAGHTARS